MSTDNKAKVENTNPRANIVIKVAKNSDSYFAWKCLVNNMLNTNNAFLCKEKKKGYTFQSDVKHATLSFLQQLLFHIQPKQRFLLLLSLVPLLYVLKGKKKKISQKKP